MDRNVGPEDRVVRVVVGIGLGILVYLGVLGSPVADIIASRSSDEWRPILAACDCCVTIMATLEEALRDPHFIERGLFAHRVAGPTGASMPALPVPIDPQFRSDVSTVKAVPKLSE